MAKLTAIGTRRTSLIEIVFAVHVTLILIFDYVPDAARQLAAAGIAMIYFYLAATAAVATSRPGIGYCFSAIMAMALTWATAYVLIPAVQLNPDVDLPAALRELAPLLALVAYCSTGRQLSEAVLIPAGWIVLVSAYAHALLLPPELLNATLRWAPFTAGLHTSAYTIAAFAIVMWTLHGNGKLGRRATLIYLGLSTILLIQYEVRTALVLFVLFFAASFTLHLAAKAKRLNPNIAIIVACLVFSAAMLTIMILYHSLSFDQISNITSGRLANYLERFSYLGARTPLEFLFGTGPGSDQLVTDVWWWDAKDSHNDFIHLLWIGGVVSLALLLSICLVLWRSSPTAYAPFLIALVASSASSNALLARPNCAFVFFAAMACALPRPHKASNGQTLKPASVGDMRPVL